MSNTESLRKSLKLIQRHCVNVIRTNSKDRGDWAEDMAYVGKVAADALAQPAASGEPEPFRPDWSLLEATQDSLREHMAEIQRLRGIVPEVLERLNDELCAENERLRALAAPSVPAKCGGENCMGWNAQGVTQWVTVQARDAAVAAALKSAQPAPAGWRLVPVEPTMEMCGAGIIGLERASGGDFEPNSDEIHLTYSAMLDAAPAAPKE